MPRKRQVHKFYNTHTPETETPDNTSAYVKYFYRVIFGLLFLFVFTSLFLDTKYSQTEIITDVEYKTYHSVSGKFSSSGSTSTDITIFTDLHSKYFISIPPSGQPFSIGDTIVVQSNLFNQAISIQKDKYIYNLGKSKGLLILLTITSLLGLLYSLFGDFRMRFVLYVLVIINSGLLLLYMY